MANGMITNMTSNSASSPRTRRGEDQHERIIAAAIELMAEGGEQAVTLVATAHRAGVARGTVYYHFANRPALLIALRANIQAQLLHLADGSHHFRNPFGLALRLAVEDESIIRSRIYRILEHGAGVDARTRKLLEQMEVMQAAGRLRPGVDPVAAALISSALDFAGLMALSLAGTQDEKRALAAAISATWEQMFVHGALRDSGPAPVSGDT
jgi:AcrR family transcriptional regulator